MAEQIEFYDLDKEYPVSYEIWKDTAAFFMYFGYKLFSWKNKFKDEAYQMVKKAYQDANGKMQNGISLNEFEVAKDKLYNNYSSFRYFFERAEKITSFNFKQKVDWTINEIYKNLRPRISPKNRFNIENDFYKNCYQILYCKLIIHYYAINELQIEPRRLIFDPLLLNNNYKTKLNDCTKEKCDEINDDSYLLSYEEKFSFSKELQQIFIDKDLFGKIDFSKLKSHSIIFKKDSKAFDFNKRAIPDFLILISYFEKVKVIKLGHGHNYQNRVRQILNEVLGLTVTNGRISRIYNRIVNEEGSYELSANDEETLFQVKEFVKEYIK